MSKGRWIASAVLVVFAMTQSSRADVTIMRASMVDGMGGLLKASTKSTESYSGDMMAADSETKMENKLMKVFGGGKPVRTTNITRLDKEVMWTIDHKDKTYTEMTFADMRAMMDSLGTMMAGGADPMAQQKPTIDTSEFTFSEPKFEVKRTGKTETISGYACDQAILTMITEGTNRKTGDTMTLELTMDLMLAQNVAGSDEVNAFGVKMAKAMGVEMDGGAGNMMTKMLSMYGIDGEELAEEARKLDGFAMKTVMSFSIGGEAMEQARAEAEKSKADQEQQDQEGKAGKEETSTDASAMAAKALGGLFGKKDKDKDKEASKEDAVTAMPPGALFWMTTTVTGIESGSVPAQNFEVPSGYKLDED